MAHLAIYGHATRGKEVIEILEMLGGVNSASFKGINIGHSYYIERDKGICFIDNNLEYMTEFYKLSLKQFLEMFPYKVGDKVMMNDIDVCTIHSAYWDIDLNRVSYILNINGSLSKGWSVDELQPYEEKKKQTTMTDIPFEAWQLIQAKQIIGWIKDNCQWGITSINTIELIEDILFNSAHTKLGLKPIGKCTIQELQEELNRRLGNNL